MGLVLFPFFILAFGLLMAALVILAKAAINNTLKTKDVLWGMLISVTIYGLIYWDYASGDEAYALGTYFVFPFFMVMLPFVISWVVKSTYKPYSLPVFHSLLISVVVSAVLMGVGYKYTFGIIEHLGLHKTY